MKNNRSFAVLGLGRFGQSVAETFHEFGYDVLALDKYEDRVNAISKTITHAVVGNAEDEKLLESLGISNFNTVIVAIGGEIQASILVTVILKELGAKNIIAKAQSEIHAKVLYKVGADKVVFPEKDMGAKVARNLMSTNILDLIELSEDHSIVEIKTPKEWIDKSLKEANVRTKYDVNIMAVKKEGNIVVFPNADYIFENGDRLIVIGDNKSIKVLDSVK